MLGYLRRMDGYTLSKVSDGSVRTVSGALVSLVALFVMLCLCLLEVLPALPPRTPHA